MFFNSFNSRYVCSVLSEMRDYIKTLPLDSTSTNHLMSLIEESQSLVNRMESALEAYASTPDLSRYLAELKEEKKKLKQEILKTRIARHKVK